MAVIPDTLRQICFLGWLGKIRRRVTIAHPSSNNTEGMPRNNTICANGTPKPAANLMQAPMMANAAQARIIHNDCMMARYSSDKTLKAILYCRLKFFIFKQNVSLNKASKRCNMCLIATPPRASGARPTLANARFFHRAL